MSLTVAEPRSPRSLRAAASLAGLLDPTRADSARSRKRTAVEVAEEELLKASLASAKLEKEVEVLLRKGAPTREREMTKLQNKKAKLSVSRDQTLPKAREKLDLAKKKALDAKTLHEAKVAQGQKKKDMHGAFTEAFVCYLVEVRVGLQDRMDNTSDKNVDVWQHITKELHRAIEEGNFEECNRRTAESYMARWTVELSAYRQWCAVCNRAITQSGAGGCKCGGTCLHRQNRHRFQHPRFRIPRLQ